MYALVRKLISGILIAFLAVGIFPASLHVEAAALTSLSDVQSTVKKNTQSNHDITFVTPSGIASGETVTITFQSDYSIASGLTFSDLDFSDDGADLSLAASPSGATWGAVRTSATVLTLTNGTTPVAGGSVMRLKIGTNATVGATGVNRVTNPTVAGSYTISIGGTFADSGMITVTIVDDDTVSVSATVNQSITFSISSNAITFGTLSSSAARYADTSTGSSSDTVAHTLAVATNGPSGYAITVQGATLTSGGNTITATGATPAASVPGTEQFGIYATAAGGTGSAIDPTFSDSATPAFGYDGTASTSASFATGSTATTTTTYSLHYLANITPTTESGSYATALTYVATANF